MVARPEVYLSEAIEQYMVVRTGLPTEDRKRIYRREHRHEWPAGAYWKRTSAYRNELTLNQFRRQLCFGLEAGPDGEPDIKIKTIDTGHITRWRNSRSKLDGNSINTDMASIRGLFTGLRDMGIWNKALPTMFLKSVKVKKHDFVYIPVSDWDRFLDSAKNPISRCLAAATLYIVGRESEMEALTVGQVRQIADNHGRIPIFRVKGTDDDDIVVISELQDEFDRYLTWYEKAMREMGQELLDEHMLFPVLDKAHRGNDPVTGRFGLCLTPNPTRTPRNKSRLVQEMLDVCGYATEKEGMHTLRRSAACAAYWELDEQRKAALMRGEDPGLDPILIVQAWMGHKDPNTTRDYVGLKGFRVQRDDVMRASGQEFYRLTRHKKPTLTLVEGVA